MLRLIDADALKAWIDCGRLRPPTEMCFSEVDVVRILDKQPTIDAEPVRHGRWIVRVQHTPGCDIGEWDEYFFANCSECGREIFLDDIACACGDFKKACAEYPYCHCGAKMDLEVQDNA